MKKSACKCLVVLCSMLLLGANVHADSKTNPVVSSASIPEAVVELEVKSLLAQGQKDTPELRQGIRNELFNRALLVQQASKLGLDKSPDAKLKLERLRENFLIESLFADYLVKHPITDADMHAEYGRQLKLLGGAEATQYKLQVIMVATDASAREVLDRLKKGESFDSLAKQKSIDTSKEQGGAIGWVLPHQVMPALAGLMVNLPKGGYSTSPIQSPAGWTLIRVEDTRPFKAPGFEESQQALRASLVQQQRAKLVESLRAK